MTQTEQIAELQGLLNELSAEVAELTETVQAKKSGNSDVSAISTGLADLLALLRTRKNPEAPKITVNVSPTPVQVINRSGNYRLQVRYDKHNRIESADILRVEPN